MLKKVSVLLIASSNLVGCGFLADAVSDKLTLDFDHEIIEPADIGEAQVQPLTFTAAVSATSPSYTLPPELDTSEWTAVLAADLERRTAGLAPLFTINVSSLTMTGGYEVVHVVRPFSRLGRIQGRAADYTPTSPATCTFTLNPDTATGAAYGTALTRCVTDWVAANGVPLQVDIEVTTSAGGPARQTVSYSVSHTEVMTANEPVSTGTSCRMLKGISSDVLDNIDSIEFTELSLVGAGASSVPVDLTAGVLVWGTDGLPVAAAGLTQSIGANQLYWVYSEMTTPPQGASSYIIAGTAIPTLSPSPAPEFIRAILETAAEAELLDPQDPSQPVGCAWWTVVGPWPRAGFVTVNISGTGKPSFE